jgi:tRNA nucleotidyltransferase/poly(A) polymerase
LPISSEARFILDTLKAHHFEAYVVGGAVRDALLSAPITDYDFTTNATPEEIQAVFPDSFYENTFGTVSITRTRLHERIRARQLEQQYPLSSDQDEDSSVTNTTIDLTTATKIHASLRPIPRHAAQTPQTLPTHNTPHTTTDPTYQITTFRTDGTYADHRRPDSVTWGTTLTEDLTRRDFTINAMAYNGETLYDPCGGEQVLAQQVIRTVGDPARRFQEDALRMLRAVRFSVQLNFALDDTTFDAISTHAALLIHISFERIRDEFLKILRTPYVKEGIELLDNAELLRHIIPELLEGKNVLQGGHHTTDVWTHALDATAACPSRDPIVRLATLLHDIAKPPRRCKPRKRA